MTNEVFRQREYLTAAKLNRLLAEAGAATSAGAETISADSVVGLGEFIDDRVDSLLVAGSGITIDYNDAGDAMTISADVSGVNIYDADWFDVTAYGATGDGVTDDTAAIQDAIDACEAAGGGTVYFPAGTYVVGGALQDGSRSNAQLLLPRRIPGTDAPLAIVLRGATPPPTMFSVIGVQPLPVGLSTIKGTLNSGAGGALIGAWGPSGSFSDITNIRVELRDIAFQMPEDPVLSCLNLSNCQQLYADNVVIHTGEWEVDSLSVQTTATSYGLRVPALDNGAMTQLGVVDVAGFYNGFEIGEHCVGQNVTAWCCNRGFVFLAVNHATAFTRLQQIHCKTGILFSGGVHYTSIQEYNIEHVSTGTWTTTYDIDDASNYATGSVHWHVVLGTGGAGPDDGFVSNGCAYLKRTRLGYDNTVSGLTDGATVTIDCNQANSFVWGIGGNRTFANPTNPYDGQVINVRIIQDGTGSRTWTLGSKFKFAGGAPALSTAAAAQDFLSCQYDRSYDTWFCSLLKNMS